MGPPPCVLVVVIVFPVQAGFESVAVLKFGALVIVVGVPTSVLPAESVTVAIPADPAFEAEDTDVKEVIDADCEAVGPMIDAAVPLIPDSGSWELVEIGRELVGTELV